MNRYILLIFVVLLGTTCRKAALVTDNTLPRVEGSMSLFEKVLKSSEEGWLVEAISKDGWRHNFWMKFSADGRVMMTGDMGRWSLEEQESSYRLRQRQQPTLSFDTYNYISELSDPDLGKGRPRMRVDFEYAFSAALADSLRALEKNMGGGVDLSQISQFEMSGQNFGSKVIFRRGGKERIAKIVSIITTLDSLKPAAENHTVRIIKIGDKEYHYNFQAPVRRAQLLPVSGNLSDRILVLTDMETKKGGVVTYYFDLEGRMYLRRSNRGLTRNPKDLEFGRQLHNSVLDFDKKGLVKKNTNLKFVKEKMGEGTVSGVFTSKKITDIPKNKRVTEAEQTRYSETILSTRGFGYTGLEKNWVKDVSKLNRLFLIVRSSIRRNSVSHTLLAIRHGRINTRVFWDYKECTEDKTKAKFSRYRFSSNFRDNLRGVRPWERLAFENMGQEMGIAEQTESSEESKDTNGEKMLDFYLLATDLGYEWHNPENNLVVRMFFENMR